MFSKPTVEIAVDEVPGRRPVYLRDEDYKKMKLPAFYDKENVTGEVQISISSRSFSHNGIKIMLVGIIENNDEGKTSSQFITLTKELDPPGTLRNQVSKFKFAFSNVEMDYESYRGIEVNVRYLLKVIISASLRNLTWEREIGVIKPERKEVLESLNDPIKMEVGIGDWLHLSFELEKSKYATKGTCTGKVTFKKVNNKLKNMLLQIIRRETIIGAYVDNTVICKYEIMDGAPFKNDTIPIRFFLTPYELTPTYPNVNNRFSVNYFINLVLYDDNDKRYYKQHEIILYRIPRIPEKRKKSTDQ